MLRSSNLLSGTRRLLRLARPALGRAFLVPNSRYLHRLPSREESLNAMKQRKERYDVLIIGGGSTGAGCAVDAATRGLSVAMVEAEDYSSGTSSRSTKLIHGGVRYLEKAFWNLDIEQYRLVREALHERATFFRVAPHIATWLPIMLPMYKWWQILYFYAGVKVYDLVAGWPEKRGYLMSRAKALAEFPMLQGRGLRGAVVYYDGQQNDSRMNITLAMTAATQGATIANYTSVVRLLKQDGKISGALLRDELTGEEFEVQAKTVLSAVGHLADSVRRMDKAESKGMVTPAVGSHITLPEKYVPKHMGLIDPSTSDGRVLFLLPWLNHTLAGTTDEPCEITNRPKPRESEVQWILKELEKHLDKSRLPSRSDVLSSWAGIRPLITHPNAKNTQEIARTHLVYVEPSSNLITISGGKWTTYRQMAEDAIDAVIKTGKLKASACKTKTFKLVGAAAWSPSHYSKLMKKHGLDRTVAEHLSSTYGDQADAVLEFASGDDKKKLLIEGFPYLEAEVRYAIIQEQARTAADIIARRTRLAYLNKQAAIDALPRVIEIMRKELNWSEERCQQERRSADEFLATILGSIPIEGDASHTPLDKKKGRPVSTHD